MKNYVVVWPDCGPLLLARIKRNEQGIIKSGYVINGQWNFEIRDGECLAKEGNTIRNRWKAPDKVLEWVVPQGTFVGYPNYNEIIDKAEKEMKEVL